MRPPSTPIPKRHHFVPIMLLENFVDAEGWLHIHRRQNPLLDVHRVRPNNAFLESDLYSLINIDGHRDPTLERQLSIIEGVVAGIFDQIITEARQGKAPSLSPQEIEQVLIYQHLQWKRTPDVQRGVTSDAAGFQMIDSLLADIEAKFPNRTAEIASFRQADSQRRILHNARVGSVTGLSSEALSAMRSRGLAVMHITARNKQFIIASQPMLKLTRPGRTHLADPVVELWFPIAPDIAIGLGTGRGKPTLWPMSDSSWLRSFNRGLAEQSSSFAASSPDLIRSLANPR